MIRRLTHAALRERPDATSFSTLFRGASPWDQDALVWVAGEAMPDVRVSRVIAITASPVLALVEELHEFAQRYVENGELGVPQTSASGDQDTIGANDILRSFACRWQSGNELCAAHEEAVRDERAARAVVRERASVLQALSYLPTDAMTDPDKVSRVRAGYERERGEAAARAALLFERVGVLQSWLTLHHRAWMSLWEPITSKSPRVGEMVELMESGGRRVLGWRVREGADVFRSLTDETVELRDEALFWRRP